MTYEVQFRPQAEEDLFQIYRYIAERAGIEAAKSYTDRIMATCLALQNAPLRGTRRDDLRPGIRTMGFERRATIVFRIIGRKVEIVRVLYGGRDLERTLK